MFKKGEIVEVEDIENTNEEQKDAQAQEDIDRCVICLENERGATLIPCGHSQFCKPCGQELVDRSGPETKCPLCREPVAQCL